MSSFDCEMEILEGAVSGRFCIEYLWVENTEGGCAEDIEVTCHHVDLLQPHGGLAAWRLNSRLFTWAAAWFKHEQGHSGLQRLCREDHEKRK